MSFHDPEVHARRLARGRGGYATIELGHARTRTGLMVQVPRCSGEDLRRLLTSALDRAAEQRSRALGSPGWWAALVCGAALQARRLPEVQRVPAPGERHVVVLVDEAPGLLPGGASWPLVRLSPGGSWLDLRSPRALELGPSDAELAFYGRGAGLDSPAHGLRRLWDVGVLVWSPDVFEGLDGRRSIVAIRPEA